MSAFFEEFLVSDPNELELRSRDLSPDDGWAFRGHASADRGLETTLHLACKRHGIPLDDAPNIEERVIREFARKAHLYVRDSTELPEPTDTLEWLSLMRHYGAPTRLLDWTYSIFVAAFFALDASEPDERDEATKYIQPSIWAVNTRRLNQLAKQKWGEEFRKDSALDFDKTGKHFRDFFMSPTPRSFVATANPYRLNVRLTIQHGVFLCPGDVRHSFRENLDAMERDTDWKAYEFRLDGSRAFRGKLAALLARQNINTEVLFPGLEGLARALRDRIPRLLSIPIENRGRMDWLGRAPRDEESTG